MTAEMISYEISDEQIRELAGAIRALDALLDFSINLTNEDRMKLPKMGDNTLAFVESALSFAEERPDLVPSYLDVEKFKKDLNLALRLKELHLMILPIVEKISDTSMAAGAQAFGSARHFYEHVKASAQGGIPGSDSIAEELRKRYQKRSARDKK